MQKNAHLCFVQDAGVIEQEDFAEQLFALGLFVAEALHGEKKRNNVLHETIESKL